LLCQINLLPFKSSSTFSYQPGLYVFSHSRHQINHTNLLVAPDVHLNVGGGFKVRRTPVQESKNCSLRMQLLFALLRSCLTYLWISLCLLETLFQNKFHFCKDSSLLKMRCVFTDLIMHAFI